MQIEKFQKKLESIDQLIRLEASGSPIDLARRLDISKSTLYEYLNYLKEIGADIYFDKEMNSFRYMNYGKLNLLCFETIDKENLNKIIGGKKKLDYFLESDFFGLRKSIFA